MDLTLTDTQTYLQDSVAGIVARDAPTSVIRTWMADDDLRPAHQLAVRQGWTGIGLSEDAGGQGGGLQDLALVAENLGCSVFPWDQVLATCVVGPVLATAGTRARELAVAGAEGETISALCLDSRTPSLRSDAVRVEGSHLNGRVDFVLGAARADVLVVCRAGADGHGVDLFEVATEASGVAVTPRRLVDGTRDLADVTFTDAACVALGTVPRDVVDTALESGVVLVAADSLGAAARMLEMTAAYVKDRQQFGVAVGSFQAVKHAAAQMLVEVEGMRSAVQFAAWSVETRASDSDLQSSVAGAFCSRAGVLVADRALFLHGAIGYTWEHDLHLYFKRAKSAAVLFGSADWHHERVCAALQS